MPGSVFGLIANPFATHARLDLGAKGNSEKGQQQRELTQDVNKFQLGDTRKVEKHQTGWEPKAAEERAKKQRELARKKCVYPLVYP